MKYLVDSVIVIDHLNAVTQATEFLDLNLNEIAISVITRAEVLAGCSSKEAIKVKLLLDQFQPLIMTNNDADLAATLRQKFKLKLPDAIQAAIAINQKLILVTRNTKDFHTKRFKNLLVPYTI